MSMLKSLQSKIVFSMSVLVFGKIISLMALKSVAWWMHTETKSCSWETPRRSTDCYGTIWSLCPVRTSRWIHHSRFRYTTLVSPRVFCTNSSGPFLDSSRVEYRVNMPILQCIVLLSPHVAGHFDILSDVFTKSHTVRTNGRFSVFYSRHCIIREMFISIGDQINTTGPPATCGRSKLTVCFNLEL